MKNNLLGTMQSHRPPRLTTEELAIELSMEAQSIRKRYSQTGSYFGLCPEKLPNGRLRWPVDAIEQLTSGAQK
ncbi:DNA-binding protein [Variovorax sp. Varisp62]